MKLLKTFHSYYFATSSGLNLGIYRLISYFSLFFLCWHFRFFELTNLPQSLWDPPGLFSFLPRPIFDANHTNIITSIFGICSFLAAIGLFTRLSTSISSILGILLIVQWQAFNAMTHVTVPMIYLYTILPFSNSGRYFSVDLVIANHRGKTLNKGSEWAIKLTQIIFVSIYFVSGIQKLRRSGLDWVTSDSLKNHLWRNSIRYFDRETIFQNWLLAERLAQQDLLCHVVAGFILFMELTLPIILFVRRVRTTYLLLMLFFIIGVHILLKISFWANLLLLLAFFPWDHWQKKGNTKAPFHTPI